MSDSYLTISSPVQGEYKEKGSKFLAFAIPVSSPEYIEEELDIFSKKYYDSRHICYAWVFKDQWRVNDAGEPNHTAGDPILNQIRSFQLSNILLIVVRYFGGTKLGKSGLINAYKSAARSALEKADIVKKYYSADLSIGFPYDKTSEIMKVIEASGSKISQQEFMEKTFFRISVRISKLEEVKEKLREFLM